MTNNMSNSHINRIAFERGQVDSDRFDSIGDLTIDTAVEGHEAYIAGIFAGLNQRMGRLQRTYDLDLEAGNDDHAIAVEQTLEQTYTLIREFAFKYLG